jgi:hypothetical protein
LTLTGTSGNIIATGGTNYLGTTVVGGLITANNGLTVASGTTNLQTTTINASSGTALTLTGTSGNIIARGGINYLGTTVVGGLITANNGIVTTSNVGVQTSSISTYALNVGGSANVSSLYIGNVQVNFNPTGQWTTSGSNIYYTAGSVGIGTNNPAYPLQVSGRSSILTTGQNAIGFSYSDTQNTNELIIVGNVSLTGFNPLSQGGDIAMIYGNKNESSANATCGLVIGPWGAGSTGGIRINSSGQVGIGTTSPGYMLDVNGNIRSQSSFVSTAYSFLGGSSPANFIISLNTQGIFVGWNNISGSGATDFVNCKGLGSGGFNFYNISTGSNPISSSIIVSFSSAGQVNAASFNASSDYRIKTNVLPLSDISYNIDKLNPVKYTNIKLEKEDMGFIAHEVQEVFPFLVTGVKDGEEKQTLNYNGFIALLVKEVQDLKKENQLLKDRLDAIEKRFM